MAITLIAKPGYIYTDGKIAGKSLTVSEEKAKDFVEVEEEKYLWEALTK